MDAWPRELTAASIFAITAVTFVICSRFLLIGAAMQPLLSRLPPRQVYPFLHFLVEPPWLLSIRYQREGGNDPGFVIGSAATCWVVWNISTVARLPARHGCGSLPVRARHGHPGVLHRHAGVAVARTAQVDRLGGRRRRCDRSPTLTLGGFWYVALGGLAGAVAGGLIDE